MSAGRAHIPPKKTRVQVVRRREFDDPPKHFKGQLTLANIFGEWMAGSRDGFFAVRWGRFYAYLHQFDPSSRDVLIAACEKAHRNRDHAHGLLTFGD